MLRLLLLLLLALPLSGRAATISSTTCPGSGCVVTYLGNLTATAVSVQVSGTWVGTLAFESSDDNITYSVLRGWRTDEQGTYSTTTTSNGRYYVPSLGALYVRVRATAWVSGSATVTPQPTAAPLPVDLVRVVGSTFGDVAVSGIVDLGASSLSALAPERTRRDWRGMPVDGGVPTQVPYALPDGGMPPLANRTEVSISYASSGGTARCGCPEAGDPLPSCTATPGLYAGTTMNAGKTVTWSELKPGTACYCVGCGLTGTDTRQIEVLEGGNAP